MAESCESSQTQGLLKDTLNSLSGSNNSNPSDMNFEVINCKLDKLMQIVALTEKKPSVQMQHLLELNDNEDEMKLYSKQVNLELQNIIKEQNFQLQKYHKEHLRKQEKREEDIFAMKELYYGQIKKQNDTIKYLIDQNGLLRKEDIELKLENEQLIESIKLCTSQKQSEQQAHMEDESLEGKQQQQQEVRGSTNEEFKLRQQVQALEKMVRLILKNRNSAQTQREEILELKNQLDQKLIENAEQINENINIKKKYDELIRNNKKNGIKSNNNNNNTNTNTNKTNVGKNQQEKRQTRGKKVNYRDIIKTYDEEIEEEVSSQESNESGSEEISSEDENDGNGSKQNITNNKENKNPNNVKKKANNNSNNSRNENNNNMKKTKGDEGDGVGSDDEQDSSFGSDEELDEEKENSDDESSYSDSSNKKKKQAKKGNHNTNNAKQQQQQKNGRAIPAKRRAVQSDQPQQQRKKKVPKKVLKKNQDAQDRMFDQVDRMMQDL